ncbi:MAG TPA: isochorismatase family cysteine hydrolase [Bryobacteraceae bacterium]|nr:isochorismatase family cysteine hydrolase [Bryobacteraceae bacterium]
MNSVFFDVDTQIDFLYPAGALYVPGAEQLLPIVARLNHHAVARGIPLVSTTDAHTENDEEFRTYPPHCVAGTAGQTKPAATLFEGRTVIPCTGPADAWISAPQYIVEKRRLDCFTNPNLPPLLDALAAERYVVYGVVTELCVRCAAFGLLARGGRVELVEDAVRSLSEEANRRMLAEFTAAGGTLTTSERVLASA